MESASGEEDGGLLHTLQPPRLEDAGLEDCALPPDSIREAFLKAASAVRSRAASIPIADSDEDDADDGCLNDPWPTAAGRSGCLPGTTPDGETPGACGNQKGGGIPEVMGDEAGPGVTDAMKADTIVGAEVGEEEKGCVDALQGLKIGEKSKSERPSGR